MEDSPPAHTRRPYRLVRHPAAAAARLSLDAAQQRVVSHSGGPLLVLAGPGTGKTATIVETVAHRIEHRGLDPARVLVLTFSRKAAGELRERIAVRLHRTIREPLALTFHSYAYALVRREFALLGEEPPRLLSGPEQLLEVRRLLRGELADGAAHWPEALRPALATRGFAEELRDFLLRAAERGMDGRRVTALGRQRRREDWMAAGRFLDRDAARFDLAPVAAYDYAEIVRIAAALLSRAATRQRERAAYDAVLVDEYQDSDPAQESLLRALAGDGARADRRRGSRPVDLRLPRRRRPGHHRVPGPVPRGRRPPRPGRRARHQPSQRPSPARAPAAVSRSACRAPRPVTASWLVGPAPSPARSGSRSRRARARRPRSSRTRSAARTWRAGSRGRRWRSWCARRPGRSRCCGGP